MADLGCAQNPDLTLRDASEITFYYDVEDEQPISGPSSKPMHPLVAGIAPLQKVAGVRHSNRKPKLSARAKAARDLDSDTDASASSTKRKATSPGRKTVTKAARLAGSASAATAAEAASGTDSDGSGSGDNYEEQKQSDAVPTSGDDALETTDTEDEDATIQARGAFEKFKAMGDADHAKAIQTKSRSDKTADIRLMFIKKKDYPHPDTGVPTNGHICIICDADGEIGIQVFFTGSVTTLRQHIARQRGHYPIYKAKCDAAGIQPHASAIPKALISNETQGTLDAVLVAKPRIPAFSSGGVRDFLTELIVTNDQALLLVEQPAFRRLLQYFRPSTQDGDIPSRQSIREHILRRADTFEEELRRIMQRIPSLIHLIHDAWTSDASVDFVNVNGAYIDSKPDDPNDWFMRIDELAFKKIRGRHTGENLATALFEVVQRYGIERKTGYVTADGASVNRTAARALARKLAPDGAHSEWPGWDAAEMDIMCMERFSGHWVRSCTPAQCYNGWGGTKPTHPRL